MRTITDHKLNGINNRITITADEPGDGGANHRYKLELIQNDEPADRWPGGVIAPLASLEIAFQNGPIQSWEDMNGMTNEALLAILIDRMKGFQGMNFDTPQDGSKPPRAPFACRENALALTHLQEAMHWLQHRTRERLQRGVEGTHKP